MPSPAPEKAAIADHHGATAGSEAWFLGGPEQRSAGEVAVGAWLACSPRGFLLEEKRARELLPAVVEQLLVGAPGAQAVRRDFLAPGCGSQQPPLLLALLRPQGGIVHFLHFWRALAELARVAGATCPVEGLHVELETLRDEVLRRLEGSEPAMATLLPSVRHNPPGLPAPPPPGLPTAAKDAELVRNLSSGLTAPPRPGISFATLLGEVHRAASMSSCPRFWQSVAVALERRRSAPWLDLEELTGMLLTWLKEVAAWERHVQSVRTEEPIVDGHGLPVCLHIYDVTHEQSVRRINRILAHESSPFKIGGIFHVGVQVAGLEWCYGLRDSTTRYGIWCSAPKTHPCHHYRETVELGRTSLSAPEISHVTSQLLEDYPGHDYDLLRRNCCHFADDFCRRLGVAGVPCWVYRLATVGAQVDAMLRAARTIRDQLDQIAPPTCGLEMCPTNSTVSWEGSVDCVRRNRPGATSAPHRSSTASAVRICASREAPPAPPTPTWAWQPQGNREPVSQAQRELAADDMGVFGRPSCLVRTWT